MSSETNKIEVSGITKSFAKETVLQGIDLSVGAGESLVLIGPSASGKTVTLKCIIGLLRPDAGSIRVDGEETVGIGGTARDRHLARFGMIGRIGVSTSGPARRMRRQRR